MKKYVKSIIYLLVLIGSPSMMNAYNAEATINLAKLFKTQQTLFNRQEAIKLINEGADPNITFGDNKVPLIYGVAVGDVAVVRALIEAGANVNHCNSSPLRIAIIGGRNNPEIVKLLLQAGANQDGIFSDGSTLLEIARRSGNAEIIKLLEEYQKKKLL